MCGRYSVYVGDDPGIREIIEQVQKLHPEVKTGEIFPTDLASVPIAGNNGGHLATAMSWGFSAWQSKRLDGIFNVKFLMIKFTLADWMKSDRQRQQLRYMTQLSTLGQHYLPCQQREICLKLK